jgi:hypothetical protein
MLNQIVRLLVGTLPMACLIVRAEAVELPVRLHYPTKVSDVVLTGVENKEVIFRPAGRDTGGRAYILIESLLDQGTTFYFMFPAEFYDAVGEIKQDKQGAAERALPIIRREAAPFLDVMELSVLPGNHLPAIYSYLDALRAVKQWAEAVEVATKIPLAEAPPEALQRIGDLALDLHEAGEADLLQRLHAHVEAPSAYSSRHVAQLMHLADQWREAGVYSNAYELYRKVQRREGPLQTRAQLWVGYCSFYLGQELVPETFLSELPEMEVTTPGYSLRELIKARLRLRDKEYDAAMRSAAEGKTYSSPADSWYPELLFVLANLYAEFEMEDASEAAHRELSILFPSSPWAKESLQVLEN